MKKYHENKEEEMYHLSDDVDDISDEEVKALISKLRKAARQDAKNRAPKINQDARSLTGP